MKKIKVLHYISGFEVGGIESFVQNSFEALSYGNEFELSVLARFCYTEKKPYKKFINSGYTVYDMRINHLTPMTYPKFKISLENFFNRYKFDILHVHAVNEPLVIEIAKKYGVKKIILHSHMPRLTENHNLLMNQIKKHWNRNNIRMADVLCGTSKEVLKTFERIGDSSGKKRIVIPNGINTKLFSFSNNDRYRIRNRFGIKNDTYVLGHIGRFVDVKNHLYLIKIFAEFRKIYSNTKLMLVGSGELYDTIIQEINSRGLDKDIILVGQQDDVHKYYNAMDIFVFPSKFEGLGLTLVEAQCNGLQCLISDSIPKDVYLTDLVHPLSIELDTKEWVKEIEIMADIKVEDRTKYSEIIHRSGFSLEQLGYELKKLYTEIG